MERSEKKRIQRVEKELRRIDPYIHFIWKCETREGNIYQFLGEVGEEVAVVDVKNLTSFSREMKKYRSFEAMAQRLADCIFDPNDVGSL